MSISKIESRNNNSMIYWSKQCLVDRFRALKVFTLICLTALVCVGVIAYISSRELNKISEVYSTTIERQELIKEDTAQDFIYHQIPLEIDEE